MKKTATHPQVTIVKARVRLFTPILYAAIALFATPIYGASLRKVTRSGGDTGYDAAVNLNFDAINFELFNVMHRTSTETIRGYKYFVDPVDFGSVTADAVTINTSLSVTGTVAATATFSLNGTWDGWIGANETWTYASATTFTTAGDLTGKYGIGDKLKLTQTTVKYFYITAISHGGGTTTVTVSGGGTYTLANAAITANYYSKVYAPQGYPVFTHSVFTTGGNGHGSTNTKIRRFTSSTTVGTAITYADSAVNGGSFTINEAGAYVISYQDQRAAAADNMGISINSNQLTTNVSSITDAHLCMLVTTPAAGNPGSVACPVNLAVGDVVRAHTMGTMDGTARLRIVKSGPLY